MAVRFTTTHLRGLHAAGRTADLQHELISAVLTSRLGPDYSALFPEFTVRDSDTRDWFVDAPPAPVPVSRLPDAERRAAYLRCHQMLVDIRALADTIEKEGSNGRIMARALRDAAVFPPEDLWVRNGKPTIGRMPALPRPPSSSNPFNSRRRQVRHRPPRPSPTPARRPHRSRRSRPGGRGTGGCPRSCGSSSPVSLGSFTPSSCPPARCGSPAANIHSDIARP
jgi:hypothetical protein